MIQQFYVKQSLRFSFIVAANSSIGKVVLRLGQKYEDKINVLKLLARLLVGPDQTGP
jgi:hypothetical protein